jgi:hypothetical protein
MASSRAAVLLPIAAIASAGGPTNDEARVAHGAREPLALGEEAVAGMDRLALRRACGRDDRVASAGTTRATARADVHGLVRLPNVRRARVRVN